MSQKLERAIPIPKPAFDDTQSVLSISPFGEDHRFLRSALFPCRFSIANSCRTACAELGRDRVTLIICERRLPNGTWKDILRHIAPLPDPPPLIVTAPSPDDHLWAEVLNLGGYDVLMKPFDYEEVWRVAALALELVPPGRGSAPRMTEPVTDRKLPARPLVRVAGGRG